MWERVGFVLKLFFFVAKIVPKPTPTEFHDGSAIAHCVGYDRMRSQASIDFYIF